MILVGCNKKPITYDLKYLECAKKCFPRAVGQIHTFWGDEVCDCDIVYVNRWPGRASPVVSEPEGSPVPAQGEIQ